MKQKFVIGDKVQLVGGGQVMTVKIPSKPNEDDGDENSPTRITCEWLRNQKQQQGTFFGHKLIKVE